MSAKLEVVLLADGQEVKRIEDERAWTAVMNWIQKYKTESNDQSTGEK